MMDRFFVIFAVVAMALFQLTKSTLINNLVCEHATNHLECPAGSTITIISALYGRQTSSVCGNGPIHTDNCEAPSSLAVVRQQCNGHRTCDVQASNGVFGDPCVGTFKYLEIQYSCGGPVPGYACEHNTFHMSCAVGKSIHVTSALYGRQISSVCNNGPISTLHCSSSNALYTVRQRCNGRRTCNVDASNSVFGDPCVGTFKYLQVGYSCQ